MKRIGCWSIPLAALLVAAAPSPAQEKRERPAAQGRGPTLLSPDAVTRLKLSDAQKEQLAKVEQAYRDAVKALEDKLRNQPRDRETQKARAAEAQKLRTDALGKIEALLGDEQKKTLEGIRKTEREGRPRGEVRPFGGQVLPPAVQERLRLTDDQKKQIETLQKELEAKILGVLTEAQRKQFEELRKGRAVNPRQPRPREQPPGVRPRPGRGEATPPRRDPAGR